MSLTIEQHGEVRRLRMSSLGSRAAGMDVSAYLLRGVLIDTGFPRARRALVGTARTLGVRGAIVTHWHEDHAGNVEALAAAGVPVAMRGDTETTLRALPPIALYRRVVWGNPASIVARVDPFDDAEFQGIHTPGHSTDHQVLWHGDTGMLFSGDLWLGVRARIIHRDEDPYRIIESLRVVLALSPTVMFDAHRGVVERPVNAIQAKIDWLGETLETIERRIAAGWSDRAIVREDLGGEERAAIVSRGEYSRANLVRAVRMRVRSLVRPGRIAHT